MDKHDDASPLLPGSQDLIRFPDQDCWYLTGDRQRAAMFRGAALQLKAGLVASSGGLAICSTSRQYDDGTVIEVRKAGSIFQLRVHCPVGRFSPGRNVPELVPELPAGQFFWVPGCFARYGFLEGKEFYNEIPLKPGSVGGDTSNKGLGTIFENLADVGLPAPGTSPDGTISRMYRVCRLDGEDPDSGFGGALIALSDWHIPAAGPFSISCVVRLRQEIQEDFSFSPKTQELGNGYTVWNPIKPRVVRSVDGVNWSAECPGSLAPLVGYKIPTRFSRHWAAFTLPWPPYNEDFFARRVQWIGYQEIATVCPGEPLLASDDKASPYWDKVVTGDLETLDGEFLEAWEENAAYENTAPCASYCKFRITGSHNKTVTTRAVGSLDDGSKRYAVVSGVDYEYNADTSIKATILTLQDYQFRLPISDASPSIVFGQQPFPVCHPQGYMIGFNLLGLCWYNGNRILAGKICDFEIEYKMPPVVSDPLECDEWHHVLMTYGEDGKTMLYVTKLGSKTIKMKSGSQSVSKFYKGSGFGDVVPVSVGADGWTTTPNSDVDFGDDYSSWVATSFMDVGLMRFYRRALVAEEAQLLVQEAFDGVFVADDHEAASLQGNGLTAVLV